MKFPRHVAVPISLYLLQREEILSSKTHESRSHRLADKFWMEFFRLLELLICHCMGRLWPDLDIRDSHCIILIKMEEGVPLFDFDNGDWDDDMKMPTSLYIFVLGSVSLPVFLFFSLWAWLGWKLFINN